MITYKFRLYPSRVQQAKLWKHSSKLNFLYNYFLNQRLESYLKGEPPIFRDRQQAELVKLKRDDPELKEIYAQVLQQVPLRVHTNYKTFLNRLKLGQGKPKFRSCKRFFGITYPQFGYKLTKKYFTTKNYGSIPVYQHREVDGRIRQISITSQDNKFFLLITTDHLYNQITPNQIVGVDVGITNLIATSEGKIVRNATHTKYFSNEISKIKSHRDNKCNKDSRRYKFLSKVINRLYGAQTRKTSDFLHKVSHDLTQQYDTIIIEDLNLKKMSESNIKGLNRELRNSCLARFVEFLTYKARRLIKVNPANTSKMCNQCGRMHNMPLSKRQLNCECGNIEDRDINAAKNILCLGRAYLLNLEDRAVALTQKVLATGENSPPLLNNSSYIHPQIL
jgi:putative transposase